MRISNETKTMLHRQLQRCAALWHIYIRKGGKEKEQSEKLLDGSATRRVLSRVHYERIYADTENDCFRKSVGVK